MDEATAKTEAVRLLWDGEGLRKLLDEYALRNKMRMIHVTVTESLCRGTMESVRLRARIRMQEPVAQSYRDHLREQDHRWLKAKLRKFAMRIVHCPPKMAISQGVAYVDFLIKLPGPSTE